MADTFRIKRRASGGAAGAPSSLASAEIAYNEVDDKLYYGKGNSSGQATAILPIAGPGMGYAPLASPVFTGNPTAPTPSAGDNDTSLATTAFVTAAMTAAGSVTPSNANPGMNGTAAPGTSALYARGDHVHPSDTSRVAKAGDTLTGDLSIAKASPNFYVNKPATSGQDCGLFGETNGKARWYVDVGDNAAETGGNAGSNFSIHRYDDAGGYLGAALSIARSTGAWAVTGSLGVSGQLSVSGAMVLNYQGTTGGTNYSQPIYFQALGAENTIYTQGYHTPGVIAAYHIIVGAGDTRFDHSGNLYLTGNGLKPGGGAWGDTSDARIKTVLGDYATGLEAVLALRPVRYTFRGNETDRLPTNLEQREEAAGAEGGEPVLPYRNSPHYLAASQETAFIGVVAQEVEPVMPELVTRRGGYIDGEKVEDLRTVDSSALIFALVNCCKELHARVKSLEEKP